MGPEIDASTTTLAIGGASAVGVVGWFLRTLNAQRSANQGATAVDVAQQGTAALITHFQDEINRQNDVIRDLVLRVDNFAKERNDLAIEKAKLEERVANLENDLAAEQLKVEGLEKQSNRRKAEGPHRPEMDIPLRRETDK